MAMLNEFEIVTVPLEKNEQGVIHISGTRVTLDSILHAYYNTGATAEEIVMRFPTCTIENVYTILAWALNNPDFVSKYLTEQATKQERLENEIKQNYASPGLRERLLARSHQAG